MTVTKDMNLLEYNYTGTAYISGGTLAILRLKDDTTYETTDDPIEYRRYLCMIRDVKKTETRAWRIRQTMSSYVARAKIKEKVEIKYSITGTCNGNKRKELDFYTRRKSKFRLQGAEELAGVNPSIGAWMSTPIVNSGLFNYDYTETEIDTDTEEFSPTQRFFVVIDNVSFSKSEGKAVFGDEEKDLYDFTIELTRVDTGSVTDI